MSSEELNAAIESIRAGNKPAAMRILEKIVTSEPNNYVAWLWLSTCVEEIHRKKYCLSQALAINPDNLDARKAIAHLETLPQPSFQELRASAPEIPQQPLVRLPISTEQASGVQKQIRPIYSPPQPAVTLTDIDRSVARMKSYTGTAVLVFFLYYLFWFPGFIVNIMYYNEAKRTEKIAGQSLPGVGCLSALLWGNIINIALCIFLFFFVVSLIGSSK